MCGRYVSATSPEDIAAFFDVDMVAESLAEPEYNIAPTDRVPVIREREQARTLDLLRWGLVPFWAKESKVGVRMINARSETIQEKGSFKHAFAKRRCIIPADGFYEWTTIAAPEPQPDPETGKRPKKAKPTKQPWHISVADGSMMAFAGLYEVWRGGEGNPLQDNPLLSCTIITTTANDRIAPIHDRMPVLLQPRDWDLWLNPDYSAGDHLQEMLAPAPSELFAINPVSTEVNNARSAGAHLREPVTLDSV